MHIEELLTRWTIRLALACYVAVVASQIITRDGNSRRQALARWVWTAGCLFFLAHAVFAFAFYHGWSHAHALADTARQTKDLLGWEFGEGIYVSYLFTLLWTADVTWWWLAPESYQGRPRALGYAIHGFLFFIAFNGAIVFEAGLTRWFGLAACAVLAALVAMRLLLNPKSEVSDPQSEI